MPDDKEGINLSVLVEGIIQALSQAKHAGDMESAKLFEVYKKNKTLSPFTVPAFTISDTDVELRFSIVETIEKDGEAPEVKVNISPEYLKSLEVHQVSSLKLKISPVNLRVIEE